MTITAPTGLAATRSTTYPDNEATLTWVLPAGVTSVTVERTWDGGVTWWPTRLGAVTRHTYRDQQPDTQYGYRVSCADAYSTSAPSEPVWLWTTPATPTLVSVQRAHNGYMPVLRFAISSESKIATGLLIQSSLDGGVSWLQLYRLNTVPATYDTEVSTYSARPHRIAVVDATGQQSAWSPTVMLAALSTPPAPTGLLSPGFDPALETTWSWVYASGSDGSAQTAYQIQSRYSTDNGATWSSWSQGSQQMSPSAQVTWPADTWVTGRWYQWQVRVWSASTTASAWSASQDVHTSARPAFAITAPTEGQVLDTTTLTISTEPWMNTRLFSLYSAEGAPLWLSTSMLFPPPLEDGKSYVLRGYGVSSDGVPSDEVVRHFSVQLVRPAAPSATVTVDPATVSATISVTNPTGGPVDVDHCEVWRGTTLVGTCAPNGTVVDRVPPLGVTEYRVAAVSSLPSRSWVTVQATITADSVIINGGENLALAVECPWNPELGLTVGRDRVSRRYDGRSYPVVVSGTELSDELTFAFVTTSQALLSSLAALVQDPAPTAYYRDPTGRAFPVGLGGLSYADGYGRVWSATLKMQRVEP